MKRSTKHETGPLCIQTLDFIRDELANTEDFYVPSEVIEWLDEQLDKHSPHCAMEM